MVRNMNGRRMTKSVPAAPQRRRRRKRGMALRGGRVALSPKELKLHARLIAEASLKSGRSGAYVYYTDKGKQRYRRYVVPKDPRTPRQHLSRAIFAAASRMWSEDGSLTEEQRKAWYASGAKRRSRPRLGQSGPLTGQQNFIGRKYARERRRLQVLLAQPNPKAHVPNIKRQNLEITTQVKQRQVLARSTTGTRRAFAVGARSRRRVPRGSARKRKGRQLMSQVARL